MTEQYEKGTKAAVDSYTAKVEVYWKKSIDHRQMLSSEEISALELMKKDILGRNGTGDDTLVAQIARVLYFNSILKESLEKESFQREHSALSEKYHDAYKNGNKAEESKLAQRINGLSFVLAENH